MKSLVISPLPIISVDINVFQSREGTIFIDELGPWFIERLHDEINEPELALGHIGSESITKIGDGNAKTSFLVALLEKFFHDIRRPSLRQVGCACRVADIRTFHHDITKKLPIAQIIQRKARLRYFRFEFGNVLKVERHVRGADGRNDARPDVFEPIHGKSPKDIAIVVRLHDFKGFCAMHAFQNGDIIISKRQWGG